MQKIYAVTFKDADGKFTVQDTANFHLAYDTPSIPQISVWGGFARDLAQQHGGDEGLSNLGKLRDLMRQKAIDYVLSHRYHSSEESAAEYVDDNPHVISWYSPAPTLDQLIPSDAFKMLPWRNEAWRDDAKYYASESPLPWPYEAITDHYAHLYFKRDVTTDKREALVRFFASPEHGMVRRATEMKPGRYLQKYYPTLDGDTVRHWATLIDAADDVRFAVSAKDIKKVYQNGPRSCMAYGDERYSSSIHPVEVYGNSDLQLAYLSFVDLDKPNFRASARALVWPERKVYGRIYGDEHRMAHALEKLGYTEGSLRGAKIAKIEEGNDLVMPYIDGECSITIHDDHCTIGGNISADSTSGLIEIEDNRAWCNGYEDYVDADPEDFIYVRGLGAVCPDYAHQYCFECARSGDWFHDDEAVNMANGETWSQRAFYRYGAYCSATGDAYDLDELVTLEDTEEIVCLSWAEANAYLSDDGTWLSEKPEDQAEAA